MARLKDRDWNMRGSDELGSQSPDAIKVNVLMDIRDELKRLNDLLHCPSFIGIPATLRSIRRATAQKKKGGAR